MEDFVAWERKLIPSPMILVFGTNKERKLIAKGRENRVETHSLLPRMESVSVPKNGLVRSIVLLVRSIGSCGGEYGLAATG